jgi:cbb3-type cytochrome oxidase subunit 3
MEDQRSTLARRTVLFGVPFLYVVLGLLHPTSNPEIGDETGFFIGLHVAQLFLIGGLAYMLWLLVEGIDSRAASVARALIFPFVIVYTALDAVLGIAWGIVAQEANELPAADQAAAGRLVEALLEPAPLGYILYFGAGLLWLAVALSVVTALWTRAPRGALVLMAIGAAVFTLGHAPPIGPIGMGLFLAGVVWLELRPRRERAAHATAMQGT